MTRELPSLYKYTPGERGSCATFSSRWGDTYNWIIASMIPTLFVLISLLAAQGPPIGTPEQAPKVKKPPTQEELPPEEDAAAKPKEYAFNPLQAENEMHAGDF